MDNQSIIILFVLTVIIIIWVNKRHEKKLTKAQSFPPFDPEWRIILTEKVTFYNNLPAIEKEQFEHKIQEFLANATSTGVSAELDDTDRLLLASNAIIPAFGFPDSKLSINRNSPCFCGSQKKFKECCGIDYLKK